MNPILKDENVLQREAWLLFGLLVLFEAFMTFVLAGGERVFPGFLSRFSVLYSTTLTDLLVLGYCARRFGPIQLVELLPRGRDWAVLGVAGLIVFFYFGLTVGREGMSSEMYDAIRDLPGLWYWLSVVSVIGIGPFLEEAIFRRYFLEILRRHFPQSIALLITAGISILFHFGLEIPGLIFVFIVQFLLGVVYVTSRLGVSFMVHALINCFVLLLSR